MGLQDWIMNWIAGLNYWTGSLDWIAGLNYWTGLMDQIAGLD